MAGKFTKDKFAMNRLNAAFDELERQQNAELEKYYEQRRQELKQTGQKDDPQALRASVSCVGRSYAQKPSSDLTARR